MMAEEVEDLLASEANATAMSLRSCSTSYHDIVGENRYERCYLPVSLLHWPFDAVRPNTGSPIAFVRWCINFTYQPIAFAALHPQPVLSRLKVAQL